MSAYGQVMASLPYAFRRCCPIGALWRTLNINHPSESRVPAVLHAPLI